jgi:PPOX class probable F420-dependent enzyme
MTAASTVPDSHRDLLDTPFATLATVGPDSRPQVSEVWFLAEDDALRVSLNATRQKTRNLVANPVISLFLLDLANPLRYLEVRGDAEVTPDEDYSFADRLAAKYGEGVDLREMDGPGQTRVVVTIKPVRIVAVDLSA